MPEGNLLDFSFEQSNGTFAGDTPNGGIATRHIGQTLGCQEFFPLISSKPAQRFQFAYAISLIVELMHADGNKLILDRRFRHCGCLAISPTAGDKPSHAETGNYHQYCTNNTTRYK